MKFKRPATSHLITHFEPTLVISQIVGKTISINFRGGRPRSNNKKRNRVTWRFLKWSEQLIEFQRRSLCQDFKRTPQSREDRIFNSKMALAEGPKAPNWVILEMSWYFHCCRTHELGDPR